MENKKRALGRGLEELFNNENLNLNQFEESIYETVKKDEIIDIPLSNLRVNPYQPRKIFDEDALKELAASIKEHGVFQPIIVKESIKGYEIIAGERRYRASKLAGKETIPAIIRNFNDEQMMEIALLENLQRENLTSIEEAEAYKSLIEKLSLTQEELAKKVGKSRSYVTNLLGLLNLPQNVKDMINENKISMAHARVLSKLEDNEEIINLANKIVNEHISVRNLEEISKEQPYSKKHKTNRKKVENEYKYVEELLRDKFDTKIKIKDKKIEISFVNNADLNRILEILDIKGD